MNFTPWIVAAGLERECRIYYMAKDRCTNKNNKDYAFYGGRGIEFRLTSFKTLIEVLGPRPPGYTLDRIDNMGHYELGNLKWSSQSEQALNRRSKPASEHHGITKHLGAYDVRAKGQYVGRRPTLEEAIKLQENHNGY